MTDQEMTRLLRDTSVIAVVGLSDDRSRPSYGVARYLQSAGYRIVPVNPNVREVLGEQAYSDLASVPFPVDLVDLFRRSDQVGQHIHEAVAVGAKAIWMQLGVRDDAAARHAREHGLGVVSNRCIAVEHRRLLG